MWFNFRLPVSLLSFFLSAWLAMLFWGMVGPQVGLQTISYPMALLVTFALWLVMLPLLGAAGRFRRWY